MNSNPNLVILDDLQSRAVSGPGYEEEMLFDFGISEDDDEVNSALSTEVSEAFNDVVFDECEFTSGLDYGSSTSQKPSSPRSSILGFNQSCSQRSKRMVSNLAAASLPFGVSDDDDSNQIMVSMSGRRKSKEWDHMVKMGRKDPDSPDLQNFQDTKSFDLKDIDKTSFVDNSDTVQSIQPSEAHHNDSVSVSEESVESLIKNEMNDESSQSNISLDGESNPFSDPPSPKVHSLVNDPIITKPTVVPDRSPDDLRRSRRAVKAPVWLDDNIDTSSPKRRRR